MLTNPIPASHNGTKGYDHWQVTAAATPGFSAAADDYAARGIDLNEQLIRNKPATFFMRINSDAMVGAGIYSGDIIIVDRSLEAKSGKVVVAVLNGEMLVRRMEQAFNKRIRLVPETKKLAPIDVDPLSDFSVWGVVTYVIHQV